MRIWTTCKFHEENKVSLVTWKLDEERVCDSEIKILNEAHTAGIVSEDV